MEFAQDLKQHDMLTNYFFLYLNKFTKKFIVPFNAQKMKIPSRIWLPCFFPLSRDATLEFLSN